jgi:hypothetical protein
MNCIGIQTLVCSALLLCSAALYSAPVSPRHPHLHKVTARPVIRGGFPTRRTRLLWRAPLERRICEPQLQQQARRLASRHALRNFACREHAGSNARTLHVCVCVCPQSMRPNLHPFALAPFTATRPAMFPGAAHTTLWPSLFASRQRQ